MRNALFHDLRLYQAMDRVMRSMCTKTPEPPTNWHGIAIACLMIAIGIVLVACVGKHATRC